MPRKIQWRWFLISLLVGVLALVVYFGGGWLLSLFGSAWRPRVWTGMLCLVALAANSVLIAGVVLISTAGIHFHWWHLLVKGVAAIALAVLLVVGDYLALLGFAFSYQPEHVMVKDGQKVVACVNSFLDVYVNYYEWQGPLTMSKDAVGSEYYGKGGFDPFDGAHDDYKPIERE